MRVSKEKGVRVSQEEFLATFNLFRGVPQSLFAIANII